MKDLKYIQLFCLTLLFVGFTACNEEDKYFEKDAQNTPIVINKIYLEDTESSVPDREVTFARLGQVIRLEGSGLYGIKHVYVNGYDTYFNRTYVSDKSILFQLNSNTPISDADESVRNTIRLVKDGTEFTYKELTIRAASPSISSVNNTMPKVGEKVTVYGNNLQETTKVTLPGGVEITDIESDEDGEWYSFTMPNGVTEAGSITSEGANGTAATPAYFNESRCIILDFDEIGAQGSWSWTETGSMINADDLVNDPEGKRGKCFQLVPERLLAGDGVAAGKPRVTECWTVGAGEADNVDWSYMYKFIPETTPLNEVALQFDIYVPGVWTGTGQLQVCLFNNFQYKGIGSDEDTKETAFYVPYIQDGSIVPFHTEGWQTVTIPFSEFGKYKKLIADEETVSFKNVVDDRLGATYQNFGMGFVNTDFTLNDVTIESTAFKAKVYVDNWRIVPCKSVKISDYPEEEDVE